MSGAGGTPPGGPYGPGPGNPGGVPPGGGAPGGVPPAGGAVSGGWAQQGGGYPPQGQQGGPAFQERAGQAMESFGRHVKTPETKEFFKTSEFAVWALTILGILISAATIGGGDDDEFPASLAWTLVTATSFAYILSRGISKSGTRRGYGDAPMDRGGGGRGY